MNTENFDKLLENKNIELMELYENKMSKNKKMTSEPSQIDFNSKQLYNRINAEFNKQSFNFLPGMILAQANTEEWHIRNENFRDLTGLIDLKINEAFEDGEWTYDISSDNQPIVYTSLSQKEIIANRNYDPIFINVILAPMVTEMLYKMNDDGENYEDTAWAQTIEDLLIKNKLNKDSYNSDYARIARKLLGIPTRKLNTYLGV